MILRSSAVRGAIVDCTQQTVIAKTMSLQVISRIIQSHVIEDSRFRLANDSGTVAIKDMRQP